ncbi:hypothetical protein AVEN_242763-1 [Araneus ventricosus]|uniref:Uncharacterized protein n=1 Tax=Araneus ventricosus TaxID=182803 RepID=A0A4Y2RW51_ARAVE|nr:hypothetical protein AVEN_59924-1 [Araneus ventricosus]GBN80114.1 hypothetical protein AVEN_242763-1 [Araneus ventricosus]
MLLYGPVLGSSLFIPGWKKILSSIQRIFLLYITGSSRTIPTVALQTITGIVLLQLKAQQEAIFINVACLRKQIEFESLSYQPRDYEGIIKSLNIHPSLISQIKFQQQNPTKRTTASCSFKFKTEMGTGCSYCAFGNGIKVLEWKGKLEKFHTVRNSQYLLTQNLNILGRWIKAHAGYRVMKNPILSPEKPSQKAL